MQIYVIRHGQTEFNIGEPRFRGQFNIPLSKLGTRQAMRISETLKSIPIETIYYSKLQRAKNTAEEIRKFHPKAQFSQEPYLLTLNFGDWQGKFHKDVFKSSEEKKRWNTNPNSFVIPNGETFYEVFNRIHRLFIRFRTQKEDTIALITHRVVIICILLYLFNLDPSHFWDFHVETASISQIEYHHDGSFRLISLNETKHLH
ncbi:MAG: histidine phosphatase family protein [Candidatus Hodarchaeales archaeon]|jgi:broad specificity phosphatase PhoE